MTQQEQRRHPRYQVRWEVQLQASTWSDVLLVTATSVSQGGLFVRAAQPAELGTELEVALALPDGSQVKLHGTVVRSVAAGDPQLPAGFAIQFAEGGSDLVLLESMAGAYGSVEDAGEHPGSSVRATVLTHQVSSEESTLEMEPAQLSGASPSGDAPSYDAPSDDAPARSSSPSLTGVPAVELVDEASGGLPPPPVPGSAPEQELQEPSADALLQELPTAEPGAGDALLQELPAAEPEAGDALLQELPAEPEAGDALLQQLPTAEPGAGDGSPQQEQPASSAVDEGGNPLVGPGPLHGTESLELPLTVDDAQLAGDELPLGEEAHPFPLPQLEPEESTEASAPPAAEPHSRSTAEMPPVRRSRSTVEAEPAAPQPAAASRVSTHRLPPMEQRRGGDESLAFGVDFGTSYSSVGLFYDGQVAVLEDEDGQCLTPTAVSYPAEGPPLVGWAAREQLITLPATTFTSPKRLLGRSYDDRNVEPFLASSAVRYSRGPSDQIVADVYGQPLTVIQVAAEVFRHVARVGEAASGRPVRKVTLAAPVAFEAQQRKAITRAAKMAGIEVVAVVDEPVAAAIAFGASAEQEELIAVYDFGGGTFDFTLLRAGGGTFDVLGEAGDAWLGGDDFDLALANHVADQFWKQKNIDLRNRQVEWQRLLFLCERAKRQLSTREETVIEATGMGLSLKGSIDLRVGINRSLFTELCRELMERSIEAVETCFALAGQEPGQVDRLVLTGGVCRIPAVRERLRLFFKRKVELSINPEEAIVMGAARFARQASGLYREG